MAMLGFVLAQVRGRPARTGALLVGVVVATAGFTVLTGSVTTTQLQVHETVQQNFRAAYDIVVRPQGTRLATEVQRRLVRPNYLSGLYGGITLDQLATVRQVPGVEIAAPIAMLGSTAVELRQRIDLTAYVEPGADRQLFRLNQQWVGDRGMTAIDDEPGYVYLTRHPLIPALFDKSDETRVVYADGTVRPAGPPSCRLAPLELLPDGTKVPVCPPSALPADASNVAQASERTFLRAYQRRPDGMFQPRFAPVTTQPSDFDQYSKPQSHLWVDLYQNALLPAAAVDPDSEAALVGLDKAIVSGRYLTDKDDITPSSTFGFDQVPALVTTRSYLDESTVIALTALSGANGVPGRTAADQRTYLAALDGKPLATQRHGGGEVLDDLSGVGTLLQFMQGSEPSYSAGTDGALSAELKNQSDANWLNPNDTAFLARRPLYSFDVGFRELRLTRQVDGPVPKTTVVGRFDPARIAGFSALSAVPLETYQPPGVVGADPASRSLLGGRTLEPTSNPAGYLASPPLVLVPLKTAAHLLHGVPDPISAIRVQLANIHRLDRATGERVQHIAGEIAARTGLAVDVVLGSSPQPQTVVLPAGKFGRPQLRLTEGWSLKGVAVVVVSAVDRKSVLLFGLILAVCTLFLANAVSAAVRDRRRELAVLACLGWSRTRLAAAIASEIGLVGLFAGVAATTLAVPLAPALGVRISLLHAISAIPVAIALSLIAAVVPAWRASTAAPGDAVTAAVVPVRRRARHRRSVVGLAASNLWRVPGRTLLGAAALALGLVGLTVLAAVTVAFSGQVSGTLLGDAVVVRARGVDVVAVMASVLLGAFAVGDVLYINVRERASEVAALQAAGWSTAATMRLLAYEGLGIGLLGAVLGAGIGLQLAAGFTGDLTPGLLRVAIGSAAVGTAVAAIAALGPALGLRCRPIARLLAEA